MTQRAVGLCLFVVMAVTFCGAAFSGESGTHYVNGVEGIKGATLPPPGIYGRLYTLYYAADKLIDADGNESPVAFDVDVLALTPRVIWVSENTILGGNYMASILVPLVNTDITIVTPAGTIDDSKFAMGDICVDAFNLTWHKPGYDLVAGFGFFAPTGDYDANEAASPGKDMWTAMFTLGTTYYFDTEKTWAASILGRYEMHSDQDERDVRYGDDLHFEWGISKNMGKACDVGLSGYCQWQVSDDSGSDASWDTTVHDRVFAAGPEVTGLIAPIGAAFNLRTLWEFNARDRTEGNTTCLVLTKRF